MYTNHQKIECVEWFEKNRNIDIVTYHGSVFLKDGKKVIAHGNNLVQAYLEAVRCGMY